MSALSQKLREARKLRVPAGRHKFIVLRPTDVEMERIARAGDVGAVLPHVIGWEDVSENDLIPGSNTDPLQFDPDACREWLSDRADLLGPIVAAIKDAHKAHVEQVESIGKN